MAANPTHPSIGLEVAFEWSRFAQAGITLLRAQVLDYLQPVLLDDGFDKRGIGAFWAVELVRDKETKATFSSAEAESLLRGFLSGEFFRRGLICRSDDRGDPVVQLSPPLISGPEEFAEIHSVLRPVLEAASDRMTG